MSVGEKLKIGVFKLNWIVQKNLEFKVHKEHTEEKELLATEADSCRRALGGDRQQIHR